MKFNLLESIRTLIRPIKTVVSDIAVLEQSIYETQPNKSYWLNKNSINCSSIAKIHSLSELNSSYSIHLWKFGKKGLCVDELKQKLANIFITKKIDKIEIDISEVGGLSASKSPIENYCSMQQFVEKECLRFFEISEQGLQSNLSHQEIRIIHSSHTSDHFKMYGWADNLFLCNSGGSHHFASAQYIAKKLGKNIPITGKMVLTYIDEKALAIFLNTYSTLLIPYSDFCYLSDNFELSGIDMVFYQFPALPAETVVMFYKHQEMPSYLDSLLKNRFTDFNVELLKFFHFQKSNTKFQNYRGLSNE